jgi:hypothetical protein
MNINMVVHVSKDKSDESLLNKTVLNPLEWLIAIKNFNS